MRACLTALGLGLALSAATCRASTARRFVAYTSGASVRAAVASGGKVWCATGGGVRVYAGGKCERRLTPAEGLPSSDVLDLAAHGDRVVAVTSAGPALLPARSPEAAQPLVPVAGALSACFDDSGRLWIGTSDGRVIAEECAPVSAGEPPALTSASTPGSAPAWPNRAPIRQLRLHERLLYAAGPSGLAAWDGRAWRPECTAGFPTGTWVSALFAHGGRLYAATAGGLWRHDSDVWREVASGTATADVRAGTSYQGELWIASGRAIYSSADGSSFQRKRDLPGVTALIVLPEQGAADREQLYAGTSDAGLWRHRGAAWEPFGVPGPPAGVLSAVAGDGPRLWVGAFSGQVAVLEAGRWRSMPRPGATGEGVAQLLVLGDEVWCRMSDGALWLRKGGGAWTRANRPWASYVGAADGRLCVGALGAAWVRDGATWSRIAPPGLGRSAVTAILRVDNRWWVGTQRGLYREAAPGKWKLHTLGTGLPDPWVTSLAVWHGRVWAGTFAGGLVRCEGGRCCPEPVSGLERVNALAAGDRLWCASPNGLYVREPNGWRRYGPEDGMPSVGINALAVSQRRISAATDGGVAACAE